MKKCSKCKVDKNEGEFSRDKAKKDGRMAKCKTCWRQYRADNAVSIAETRKRYKATPEARYATYKESAAYRGFTWSLAFGQFMEHWKKPCTWCGVDI